MIIIDRTRNRSRSITNEKVLADLNEVLGSGFNLKLARALRSRIALFVEGHDMKVLKNIARAVRADSFAKESGLTIAPMGGAANRELASSFGWLNEHLLENAVDVQVILDRDYMTDEGAHDITEKMRVAGVSCHIWRRKELESYLLIPSLISRCAGAPQEEVEELLLAAVEGLRNVVLARYLDYRTQHEMRADRHAVMVSEHYLEEFTRLWQGQDWARDVCPAKDVLSALNQSLQERGYKAVSARGLSARIRSHEVPAEMRDVILDVEGSLTSPVVSGDSPALLSMWGNLHLKSGLAASRAGDAATADDHLQEAQETANRIGVDRDDYRLAFGPTNVQIWGVALAVERLDGTTAVRRAAGFEPPASTPPERTAHHWIDLARGYFLHGSRQDSLNTLLRAREVAPQMTRFHPQVRETVTALAEADRRSTRSLAGFARWVGV